MLAAFPTIKFPDQNIVVKINKKYAKLLLFTNFKQTLKNYMVVNQDWFFHQI